MYFAKYFSKNRSYTRPYLMVTMKMVNHYFFAMLGVRKGGAERMFGFSKKHIIIMSPMDGEVVPITELSDPVFSGEILGRGIAIMPDSECVKAPAKAVVNQMFDTGHAVSLLTDSGVELLIHVGIDTVNLKGNHYTIHKSNDESVDTGDVLMEFDADAISAQGYDTVTPVVVCNPYAFRDIYFASEGYIKAGEPLIALKA